jgi:hypothetical protein
MPQTITCRLDVPARIRLGDSLLARFTLTNNSEHDYYVLRWYTPLEGINSPCLSVHRDGKPVRYDGRLIKRSAEPPAEAYVLVPAGQSVSYEVDVTEAYPIDAPGVYDIKVDTEILDHVKAAAIESLAMRGKVAKTEPSRQSLASDTQQVQVEPGLGVKHTVANQMRRVQTIGALRAEIESEAPEAPAPKGAGRVDVVGGNSAQQTAARAAWTTAHQMAHSSFFAIGSALYNTWFGTPTAARQATVRNIYGYIKQAIRTSGVPNPYPKPPNPTWQLILTGEGCQAGWFAYTYQDVQAVWLCGAFWSAPATGIDSQAGTLVHEMSHAVGHTSDHQYGTANAQNLANTNPDQAVDNADNFEYFAENAPVVPVGPYDFASPESAETSVLSPYHR